ncbi:hypothetical protein BH11CYA1_BH11CYA1_09720 [soil metagenome]
MLNRDLIEKGHAVFAAMLAGERLEYVDDALMAPQALVELLTDLQGKTISIEYFCFVHELKRFLSESEYVDVSNLSEQWQVASEQLLTLSNVVLCDPGWKSRVEAACSDVYSPNFGFIRWAAELLDIDTWEQSFRRVQSGENDWFFLNKTADQSRIARLEQYAEDLLAQKNLKSELLDLEMVFCGLHHWPAYKNRLIVAALRSSVAEFRYIGLTELREAPPTALTEELEELLCSMTQSETDTRTKIFAANVLNYHSQVSDK